jgi:hypothetical protein
MIRSRRDIVWLALAALVLRCLVPPGFMPEAHPDQRGFRMVLCSGAGTVTLTVDADGVPIESGSHVADSRSCPFSAVAFAAAPPAPPLGFLALAQAVPDPLPVSLPPPQPVLAGPLGPRAPPFSPGSST